MSTELDVEFNLDETLTINCEVKDSDGETMNLTGFVTDNIRWGISRTKGGTRLATLAIGTGITIVSASAGTITIKLEPANQDDLHPGRYYHECQVLAPSGTSIQFEGKATIRESMFATEA